MPDTKFNSLGLPNFFYGNDCLTSNLLVLPVEHGDLFESGDELLCTQAKLVLLDVEALYVELVYATRHATKRFLGRFRGLNVNFLFSTREAAPK